MNPQTRLDMTPGRAYSYRMSEDYSPDELEREASALSETMRDALRHGATKSTMESVYATQRTLAALERRGLIEPSYRVGSPGAKWRVSAKGVRVARLI
jgi:hypothetical protein